MSEVYKNSLSLTPLLTFPKINLRFIYSNFKDYPNNVEKPFIAGKLRKVENKKKNKTIFELLKPAKKDIRGSQDDHSFTKAPQIDHYYDHSSVYSSRKQYNLPNPALLSSKPPTFGQPLTSNFSTLFPRHWNFFQFDGASTHPRLRTPPPPSKASQHAFSVQDASITPTAVDWHSVHIGRMSPVVNNRIRNIVQSSIHTLTSSSATPKHSTPPRTSASSFSELFQDSAYTFSSYPHLHPTYIHPGWVLAF